ncbi:MAG: malate synthase A [Thermomonas hydrothermalis]|uniref:malate synthase A n=1 Tax=Thermomonas hydrothermalis TaxID=213588 RepID=UPI002354F630|nr:malate synthase A [Thermomonas hydrothermalis]MCL6619157.1 malate synthase A [Thermomonas hydrothermalis]
MSAVLNQIPQAEFDAGIDVTGRAQGQQALLTPAALAFLAGLHRAFEPARQARLAARQARQQAFDAGALPQFRADTAHLRAGDWTVAPAPAALRDRRVEITGPVDPKMVINALNSGANCYMADFEDSTSPTWTNLITGQQALRAAISGDLVHEANGKRYALHPQAEQAVLIVRPRGWHLDEKHVLVDGRRMSAALFDAGLFCFHNAKALAERDRGPYLYLPKLESMEEAALWGQVLDDIEARLGLPHGQIRVTVLIETLPAAFEMDEILYALKDRIVGLNCGRWDYIFSYIKTLRRHPDRVLPERGQVTMTQPFLRAYSELLIQTCHRRGAHAMGGMAAQIPIRDDAAANAAALARVRADKLREVTAGHDGTWVAHPGLIAVAREVFDARMPGPNQLDNRREDVHVEAADLLQPCLGTITRAGFENNVEVCVRYLAAWLDGNGCVPIHHLMEDAATAEIARAQLWQWLHFPELGGGLLHLDDGTPVDFALLERALIALPGRLRAEPGLAGIARVSEAIGLLDRLTHAETLAPFLTLPAYERLD